MFVTRLNLICVLVFFTAATAFAQRNSPAPSASQPARALPQTAAQESPRVAVTPRVAETPRGPQITFNSVYVEEPYIAITFDDGPHATLTPKLLDMLAARRIKATFFVVGQCVADLPEIVKRAAREGHEIASHSWSHPNLGKMSDEAVRSQLQRTDDAIKAAIGTRPTVMRPPYGSITPRQKSWIHDEFGYKTIIWDVDPFDWKRPGASVVRDRIVNQTKAGSIILVHDIHPASVEAMPGTFDQLLAKGFKFATVSELLAMARPAPPKPPAPAKPPAPDGATANPQDTRTPPGRQRPEASPIPSVAPSPAESAPPTS